MKTWKIGALLLILAFGLGACDDDEKEELNNPGGETTGVDLPVTNFGYEAKTVLKNSGRLQIPILLDKKATAEVKVAIGVKPALIENTAREGMDFNIEEKVVNILAGDSLGYVNVELLDNREADGDREFEVVITGVFGGGKANTVKQSCRISVVSNSFVEFEKPSWDTWEAAAAEDVPEAHRQTRFVPLVITGEIKEASTLIVQAVDGTAKEYYHFTLASKEITVNPGDTRVMVELLPVDDAIANSDRVFRLELKYVKGGNLTLGKNNLNCQVTIISEEVLKTASFEKTSGIVKEGETIQIPVVLDHAPEIGEDPVIVTVSPLEGAGTAVADKNYTIKNSTLTFNPGQKQVNLEIEAKADADLFDHKFTLEIKSAIGAEFVAVPCKITIENDDFPSFKAAAYASLEGSGGNGIPVCIPAALDYDVTLKIQAEAQTAEEGVHYTLNSNEVVISKGTTESYIWFEIGGKVEWLETPKFTIKVIGVDEYPVVREVQTIISLTKNETYRKWLGTWKVKTTSLNQGGGVIEFEQTFSAGETIEQEVQNFGKNYIVTNYVNAGKNYRINLIDNELYFDPTMGIGEGGKIAYWANGWVNIPVKTCKLIVVNDNQLKYIGYLAENWYDSAGQLTGTTNGNQDPVWTRKN